MEHDVVFSYKVYKLGILALPPLFPRLRQKFLCVGYVADRRIEPNIEDLAFRTLDRHRNTPIEVSADSTWLKTSVDPALALAIYIASPLLMSFENPFRQPSFILVQRQIPMLGLLLYQLTAA